MSKAISLHLGLNALDPDQYEGWDGQLVACEADAKDMESICKKKKFAKSTVLLTRNADSLSVKLSISDAAFSLIAGDLFVLTYSGHGGQVPDRNGDDSDSKDETWCLYDREVIDDELYAMLAKFSSGVRILVLSDSCHSGTVTRVMPKRKGRFRLMPPDVAERVYRAHKKQYDKIQADTKAAAKVTVKASVILISGCQDNQLSDDGDRNGLFTEKLRKVWDNGKFKAGHRQFRNEIAAKMPEWQSPNYYTVGKRLTSFEKSVPFTK